MALSGDEIRRRLGELASRWGGYQGSERSEAQTFLNELLQVEFLPGEEDQEPEEPERGVS